MNTAENAYTQEYDASLSIAGQQKDSRLLRTVEIDTTAAVNKYFERMDALDEPQQRSGRFQPVNAEDIHFTNRIVSPVSFEKVALLDSFDKMRQKIQPQSDIVKGQGMAYNRKIDDIILAGLLGTAYGRQTIESPIVPVTFPASQVVPVDYVEPGTGQVGNQGLTVGKLKEAKRILFGTENAEDTEPVYCLPNQAAINQLLRDQQVTSIFQQEAKPLVDGNLNGVRFLGLEFIRTERVAKANAGVPAVLVYTQSAAKFAWMEMLHGEVAQRHDLQGQVWQLKANASMACSRMWEERVVKINIDLTK